MNKKMSNAPVYYTIAQAQFNPIAAMANYINDVQDKFRHEGFTLFETQKIKHLQFDTSSTPLNTEVVDVPVWRITKSDRSAGFILYQSQVVYHTTHYQTHTHFFNEFLLGLKIIHSIIKLDHLSRLGLRYLNAVLPNKKENIDQYLVDGLHGIYVDATQRYSLNEAVFDTNPQSSSIKGTLVNRVHCRTGQLGYPPDMIPSGLSQKPQFAKEDISTHAIIDIDHFIEGLMQLNLEQLKIHLNFLHTHIKQAFDATTTKHAKKIWD